MSAVATPNLVGITGIARRLVQDGALDETKARAALTAASAEKVPVASYLLDKRLVTPAAMAAANSIECGSPLFDASVMEPELAAIRLGRGELIRKHCVLPRHSRRNRLFGGIAWP